MTATTFGTAPKMTMTTWTTTMTPGRSTSSRRKRSSRRLVEEAQAVAGRVARPAAAGQPAEAVAPEALGLVAEWGELEAVHRARAEPEERLAGPRGPVPGAVVVAAPRVAARPPGDP